METISNGFISISFFPKEGEGILVEEFKEGRALIVLDKGKALFLPHKRAIDVVLAINKNVEETYLAAFYRFWKEGKIAIWWDKERKDFVTMPSVLELMKNEK